MRLRNIVAAIACLLVTLPCFATVLSSLHGVIHDPQHFPIKDARVTLHSADSAFELKAVTDASGKYDLNAVPLGVYIIHVEAKGFGDTDEVVTMLAGTNPILHISLNVAGIKTTVTVSGTEEQTDTVTPTTLVTRKEIDETPGASRTIGTQMITDYVPGA